MFFHRDRCVIQRDGLSVNQLSEKVEIAWPTQHLPEICEQLATVRHSPTEPARVGQQLQGDAAPEPSEVQPGLLPRSISRQQTVEAGKVCRDHLNDPALCVGVGDESAGFLLKSSISVHHLALERCPEGQGPEAEIDPANGLSLPERAFGSVPAYFAAPPDDCRRESIQPEPQQPAVFLSDGLDPGVTVAIKPIVREDPGVTAGRQECFQVRPPRLPATQAGIQRAALAIEITVA